MDNSEQSKEDEKDGKKKSLQGGMQKILSIQKKMTVQKCREGEKGKMRETENSLKRINKLKV